MKKLTILGSINADHVISVPHFAKPGETLTGSDYHIAYGGKGANQAVAERGCVINRQHPLALLGALGKTVLVAQ